MDCSTVGNSLIVRSAIGDRRFQKAPPGRSAVGDASGGESVGKNFQKAPARSRSLADISALSARPASIGVGQMTT
jgi:hypothetical protein